MATPKKAPSITKKALEPDPWEGKTKIKKRSDVARGDDPIGT
jgi:hypothetical protein